MCVWAYVCVCECVCVNVCGHVWACVCVCTCASKAAWLIKGAALLLVLERVFLGTLSTVWGLTMGIIVVSLSDKKSKSYSSHTFRNLFWLAVCPLAFFLFPFPSLF